MKTNFINTVIIILCIFYLISCSNRNKDYDLTNFFVEVSNRGTSNEGFIDIKIGSDTGKKEDIRAVYTVDDKKSSLTSFMGEEILPNESFIIDSKDFETTRIYKFNPSVTGEHHLEFSFFNFANYGRKCYLTIIISGDFKFTANPSSNISEVNKILNLDFEISPEKSEYQFPYKLKFNIEDPAQEATLNGYNRNTWFDVRNYTETLAYIPQKSGLHVVTITAKNKFNIEKSTTFSIEIE